MKHGRRYSGPRCIGNRLTNGASDDDRANQTDRGEAQNRKNKTRNPTL